MTDWVVRKFATDVDKPVLAKPRKGFFVRFMEALGNATPSSSPRDCKTRSPIIKRFLARTRLWILLPAGRL